MVQVRQLIERGECAGVLPSLGLAGLSSKDTHIIEFPPLAKYGRHIVLHWNERQMSRRGVAKLAVDALVGSIRG